MKIVPILLAGISLVVASAIPSAAAADELQKGFATPPDSARPWCYWWWLNGAASKEGITRDFEQMKSQGIGGALLFDAGEAGAEAPRGPQFLSSDWRVLFKHAVREADRLGIVLSVNLCSGWNAGGPWVTPEHAAKKLIGVATTVRGPGRIHVRLPQAQTVQGFYRDIAVLASPVSQIAPPRKSTADSEPSGRADRLGPSPHRQLDQIPGQGRRIQLGRSRRDMGGAPHRLHASRQHDEVRWLGTGGTGNRYDECRGHGRALCRERARN